MNERLWRCDCGAEAVGVSFYDWSDPPEWFIEVYKLGGSGWPWRLRLRRAFDLLLGRDIYIDAVSLDRRKVEELIGFLQENATRAALPGGNDTLAPRPDIQRSKGEVV